MSRVIQQIEIEGNTVWVEMEDLPVTMPKTGKFADTASPGDVAQGAVEAIKRVDISSTLNAIVAPIKNGLAGFKPDEVNVELTLGFKADVGVFVASGEANAQIKVSAKWKSSGG